MAPATSASVAMPEELRTGSTSCTFGPSESEVGAWVGTSDDQEGCSSAASASAGRASTSGEEATEVPVSVKPDWPESSLTRLDQSEESGIHTSDSVSPEAGPAPVMP